jgi:hypothetical protein
MGIDTNGRRFILYTASMASDALAIVDTARHPAGPRYDRKATAVKWRHDQPQSPDADPGGSRWRFSGCYVQCASTTLAGQWCTR